LSTTRAPDSPRRSTPTLAGARGILQRPRDPAGGRGGWSPRWESPTPIGPEERDAMSLPYERERAGAVPAGRGAAAWCRAVRARLAPEVLAKADRSPVTVADFGSQALVGRTLAGAFHGDPLIAEEDAAELRRPENSGLLARVVEQVRAFLPEAEAGADAGV